MPDIDRAKMDPKSVIAVITDSKAEEFYELGTKMGKLKVLFTRNQFILCKENFLIIEEVGKEEINVREVVEKAFFSWWTDIEKMQLYKEVYQGDVFVQISQFTL
jgi:hypothetical protein